MKKLLVCLTIIMMLVQLFCCPTVLARGARNGSLETTTTADTTETTTTASDTDTTTTEAVGDATTTTGETVGTTALTPTATVNPRLIILDVGGKLAAHLTDENGIDIPGVPVKVIQIAVTRYTTVSAVTDENGYAIFDFEMPVQGTYIYCQSETTIVNGVMYTAAAASAGAAPVDPDVTTTISQQTVITTFAPTYNRTDRKTTARKTTQPPTWYTFAATTGMEESYVSLGFSFDSGILSAFKTDETKFRNTALLLLSPEAYTKILGDMKGTLFMTAAASAAEVTDEHIAAAIENDAVLSLADAKNVERVVMDIALKLESPTGKQTDVWSLAADSYVIQLPVPHNMRSAKAIAVAAVTAEGISAPVYATVSKDGFLRFETTSPVGTIVLLGFKNNILAAFTGDSAILAIVFLVVGLLCIGGAVFLYIYFFYLPRRAKKKEEIAAAEAEESEHPEEQEQPFSLEDLPPAEGNERIDHSLDIFSEDVTEEPKTGGNRSNIDIPL